MTDFGEIPENNSPLSPSRQGQERNIAVAIKGNALNPNADSRVVASGKGRLADQILALAFERGINVREDADLAEVLALLDIDTPIPTEAVMAVAQILAKVYEVNNQLSDKGGGT